jgi:hypothetical protein
MNPGTTPADLHRIPDATGQMVGAVDKARTAWRQSHPAADDLMTPGTRIGAGLVRGVRASAISVMMAL